MSHHSTIDEARDQNVAVLANLTDLVAGVVSTVAGNDIANTIEGEFVGAQALREMIAANAGLKITQMGGGV